MEYILLIICVIISTIFVIYRVNHSNITLLLLKVLSSLAILISGLILGYLNNFSILNLLLILGMLFGLLGDIFLDLKLLYIQDKNKYLLLGFTFFGLGHFAYLAEMITITNSWLYIFCIIPSALVILIVNILSKLLKINFETTKPAAFTYCFILAFMFFSGILSFILNNSLWPLFIGFTLFTISDGILSLMYYAGLDKNKVCNIISHVTYYAAQIFITFSILFI